MTKANPFERQAVCIEVTGFDRYQRERADELDGDWTDFFARLEVPVRLISQLVPYDLDLALRQIEGRLAPLAARERALRPLAAGFDAWKEGAAPEGLRATVLQLPGGLRDEFITALERGSWDDRASWGRALDVLAKPLWRLGPLKGYRQELKQQRERGDLRGLRHFLLAWLPPGMRPEQLVRAVEDTFDTSATLATLPSILAGPYVARYHHLQPADPRHPYVALLAAYDRQGVWSPAVLERVLQLNLDVALCVDVELVNQELAATLVSHTEVSAAGMLQEHQGPRDVRAERKHASAHRLQAALTTQRLHALRIVVAVAGATPAALDDGARLIQQAVGSKLRLMRPGGGQRALEQFFRPVPTSQIVAPAPSRYEPSRGAAVSTVFGVSMPVRAEGVEFLRVGRNPVTLNLFQPGRAAHGLIVGATGIGKTFGTFCWVRRIAVQQGVQVLVYEPQGHGRYLAAACGTGARHLVLNPQLRANPLDVVIARARTGEAPALLRQVEHVINQLSVLLATNSAGGETIIPRGWASLERGMLALALQAVYAPWAGDLSELAPERTPVLADLCHALGALAHSETSASRRAVAQELADEIDVRLVRGPHGVMFNGITTIDWQLDRHDVLCFDFSDLEAGYLRTYFYTAAFGALYRHIHNPHRAGQRPVLAVIDEFRIMAQVPELREFVASFMKHARTFGGHLWVVDQDFHVLDGPDEASQSIITNTTFRAVFHQEVRNAQRIAQTLDGIRPHHVRAIQRPVRGQCVISYKADGSDARAQDVIIGRVVPTPDELGHFRRT
ncbi:MAG TPA: hypothetical protein VFS21_08195 [Roseiflexaceae bacterium]|nr:hypothetical protein [Roseiflexaceae bacterium]